MSEEKIKVFSNSNGENLTKEDLLDPATKKFAKGNPGGPGRPKGSRNRMTQEFMDRMALLGEETKPEAVLINIMQTTHDDDLRYKCASKLMDLVYPKASSVEVVVDTNDSLTPEEIEAKLRKLTGSIIPNAAVVANKADD